MRVLVAMVLALLSCGPALAREPNVWRVIGAPGDEVYALVIEFDQPPGSAYVFRCAADSIFLTHRGVTEITDRSTGKVIGDAPGSEITPAASVMGIMSSQSIAPTLYRAAAQPNSKQGWDLTIRLSRSDPALRSLTRSTFMSVMTLGSVHAVSLGEDDRKLIKGFLGACQKT